MQMHKGFLIFKRHDQERNSPSHMIANFPKSIEQEEMLKATG